MVLRLKLLAAEVEQLAEEAYMPHTAHGCGQQDANHKIIINVNTKNKKIINTRNKEFRMASSSLQHHVHMSSGHMTTGCQQKIIINRNTKNKQI